MGLRLVTIRLIRWLGPFEIALLVFALFPSPHHPLIEGTQFGGKVVPDRDDSRLLYGLAHNAGLRSHEKTQRKSSSRQLTQRSIATKRASSRDHRASCVRLCNGVVVVGELAYNASLMVGF